MALRKFAIVGSRRYQNESAVRKLVRDLASKHQEIMIVSGGARGPDTWAENEAESLGIPCISYRAFKVGKWDAPDWEWGFILRGRNSSVVELADEIHAFVAPNRKGGTEDTISKAKSKKNKPIFLYDESGEILKENP